jgi:hypothetical protein
MKTLRNMHEFTPILNKVTPFTMLRGVACRSLTSGRPGARPRHPRRHCGKWGVTLSYFPGQYSGGSIITTNLTRTSGYGYRRILENEYLVAAGLYRV